MANLDTTLTRLESLCSNFSEKLAELKDTTNELYRTLRGHNGDPGLVSRMINVESQLTQIAPTIVKLTEEVQELKLNDQKGHVCYQTELINQLINSTQSLVTEVNHIKEEDSKPDESVVSWTWLRDKLIQPVMMLLIGYLFFQLLPKLVILLENPHP